MFSSCASSTPLGKPFSPCLPSMAEYQSRSIDIRGRGQIVPREWVQLEYKDRLTGYSHLPGLEFEITYHRLPCHRIWMRCFQLAKDSPLHFQTSAIKWYSTAHEVTTLMPKWKRLPHATTTTVSEESFGWKGETRRLCKDGQWDKFRTKFTYRSTFRLQKSVFATLPLTWIQYLFASKDHSFTVIV